MRTPSRLARPAVARNARARKRRKGWPTLAVAIALAAAIALFAASPGSAQTDERCTVPPEAATGRPDADAGPTRVEVGLFVLDVMAIDDAEQATMVDVFLGASWRDPRLTGLPSGCRVPTSALWHPQLATVHRRGSVAGAGEELLEIEDGGVVRWRRRGTGELPTPLDLREFPFDAQRLVIEIASERHGPDEVTLAVDRERTAMLEELSLAGWTITLAEPNAAIRPMASQPRSVATFVLRAERHFGFYLWKVILPLSMILFMAWTVFWIDPADFGPQTGVATASVLTLIAFQLSLGHLLPRISYLTRMDRFVLGATTLVFLALAEVVLTSKLARDGRVELARRLDLWGRVLYPALFAGVLLLTVKL